MTKFNATGKPAFIAAPQTISKWNEENGAPPSAALGEVLKEIKATGLADQTTQRMGEILARFTIYVEKGHGLRSVKEIAEEHLEGFVFASVLARADRSRRPSVQRCTCGGAPCDFTFGCCGKWICMRATRPLILGSRRDRAYLFGL